MTNFVKIKHGTYRKNTVENTVFPIVKPLNIGKKGAFITVDGTEVLGDQFGKIRVLIEDPTSDLEYVTPAVYAEQPKIDNTPAEASIHQSGCHGHSDLPHQGHWNASHQRWNSPARTTDAGGDCWIACSSRHPAASTRAKA